MVGSGPAMQSVYQQIDRAAPTRARVLILGASGSGKERVAHAIHRLSNRSGGPLVAVNCAAIPEALIEDELFGHVRHAFTDAKGDRAGCFVRADGGTLLLDEISEMSLMTQAKVLRAIETGEVLPVGADAPVKVDVRIVSASNKSLKDEIEQGNFREDLFYRLNVIPIRVPRLAERMEDVEPLVNVFIEEAAAANGVPPKTLTSAARATLMEYAWPGNVRELQNVVERVVIMGSSSQVTGHDVAEALRPGGEPDQSDQPLSLRDARRRFERDYIRRILQEHDWRIQETANVLGINRSHLWRKMQGLGIEDGPDMNGSGNGA
jgi:two-component system nitrogen regulation response regulator NtrX